MHRVGSCATAGLGPVVHSGLRKGVLLLLDPRPGDRRPAERRSRSLRAPPAATGLSGEALGWWQHQHVCFKPGDGFSNNATLWVDEIWTAAARAVVSVRVV
jgi:hypothetical protein